MGLLAVWVLSTVMLLFTPARWLWTRWQHRRMWVPVTGRVIGRRQTSNPNDATWRTQIEYETDLGRRTFLAGAGQLTHARVGEPVALRYDPNNTGNAETVAPHGMVGPLIAGAMAVVSLVLGWWTLGDRGLANPFDRLGIRPGIWMLPTMFTLLGSIFFLLGVRSLVHHWRASEHWVKVSGVVVGTSESIDSDGDVTTYEIVEYPLPDGTRARTQSTFGSSTMSGADNGTPREVHVNPDDPTEAYVANAINVLGPILFTVLGMVFAAAGLAIFAFQPFGRLF